MNVLIVGSGGREHAMAWKISQSPRLSRLFIAPGNAGTASLGENVSIGVSDFPGLRDLVLEKGIGMVVVGPEVPLVDGIHDFFLADPRLSEVVVIGPVKQAAMLEGSKDFAKAFMARHAIPTARYRTFGGEEWKEACAFLESLQPPYVLKADGLAAGKGVVICKEKDEARAELRSMLLDDKFGGAGRKVVIEEYLNGIEISAFVLTDGTHYQVLPSAKDYKRIGEGDTGPNTGGMGSVSPVPFADEAFNRKVEERIIAPTIKGLKSEGIDYRGFIFFGLMNVGGDPWVIEYNARMGDPEAEAVVPRIKNDLLEMFLAVGDQTLDKHPVETDNRYTAAVMMVSKGYPGNYEKNKPIEGLEDVMDVIVFHAGTVFAPDGREILTQGGRVLAVTAYGNSLIEAFGKAYHEADNIYYENKAFRKDLGQDLLKYT